MRKLSVIIPVYNTFEVLPRCIDSVLNQGFADFELILVDDGSTDGSGALCDGYAAKDARVSVFHQPRRGPSSARNVGLEHAMGEWVTFIDSDDYIDSGYFDLPYSSETDLYVRNWCYANGQIAERLAPQSVEADRYWSFLKEHLHCFSLRTACSLFFKKKIITQNGLRYDERFRVGEDTLFVLDYYTHASSLKVVDGPAYRYDRSTNWEEKHCLTWDEGERYLSAFMDKYDALPIKVPLLVEQIFGLFRALLEKREENLYCKWVCGKPVCRMLKSQTIRQRPFAVVRSLFKTLIPPKLRKSIRRFFWHNKQKEENTI